MRQISLTEKKVRGIPRRLRSLRKWAESFSGWFPQGLKAGDRYCHWKIPVLRNLVEGRQAKKQVQIECAQRLIDATGHLIASKPEYANAFRVTCVVCLPDMFTSEVCIYLQEEYFRSHTAESVDRFGATNEIKNRSLAKEWGLILPDGVSELGVAVDYRSDEDDGSFVGERWYFGEVQHRG